MIQHDQTRPNGEKTPVNDRSDTFPITFLRRVRLKSLGKPVTPVINWFNRCLISLIRGGGSNVYGRRGYTEQVIFKKNARYPKNACSNPTRLTL